MQQVAQKTVSWVKKEGESFFGEKCQETQWLTQTGLITLYLGVTHLINMNEKLMQKFLGDTEKKWMCHQSTKSVNQAAY